MVKLSVDMLDSGAAVINVGESGAYVMVECTSALLQTIQVTVFNNAGDVVAENEYNYGRN